MARMRQWLGLTGMGAIVLATSGCVPQEKYTALKLDDDQLRQQLAQSQSDTQQAQAEAASYKSQLAAFTSSGNSRDAIINNLTSQNQNLQQQLDELNRKYAEAMGSVAKAGATALPAPLSNALSEFAAQNPDLVDFDPGRGVVKFKSDVTFAVGDATITPKAREVLDRFSQILDSPAAANYELLVAGHTDSTPVSNPATKAKGHKDNWYLSAHRAITVSEALISDGVNPRRLGAVGYADERPIASNATEAGKAQNRRVEVLILPTAVSSRANFAGGGTTTATPHHHTHTAPPPPPPAPMNKDATPTESMNK